MLKEKEIAVRLFENQKYGTTQGKGLYRTAMYNATAEIKDPHTKYLLDFDSVDKWQHGAKNADDMVCVNEVLSEKNPNLLASWVKHYDPATKTKTRVMGMATLDVETLAVTMIIYDVASNIEETWKLNAKPCKSSYGKNSPQLLATNSELTANW